MGSKARLAKNILPIILKIRKPGQYYVEPFCGGCNTIDKVDGPRIANDWNPYLVAMIKSLQLGWDPPFISKEQYTEIRRNKDKHPPELVGWVGFICSFRAKFFGGFNGGNYKQDYQGNQAKNLLKQIPSLQGVEFYSGSYEDLVIPAGSIIYCDPPYQNTTGYMTGAFDHAEFWQWVRNKSIEGHEVFISEYNAPADFECIYEQELTSNLSGKGSGKKSVERLFRYLVLSKN